MTTVAWGCWIGFAVVIQFDGATEPLNGNEKFVSAIIKYTERERTSLSIFLFLNRCWCCCCCCIDSLCGWRFMFFSFVVSLAKMRGPLVLIHQFRHTRLMLSIFEFGIRWINYLFETTNHVCHFLIRSILFRFCNKLRFFFLSVCQLVALVLSSHALYLSHFQCIFETCLRLRAIRLLCKLLKYSRGQSLSYFILWLMWKSHDLSAYCVYIYLFFVSSLFFSSSFSFDWIYVWSAMIDFIQTRLRIFAATCKN